MICINWFLWLITYSFVGWVYESIICSIEQRKLVNRGFLNGPLCPVYGIGALVCIICLYQRIDNTPILFLLGMVLTCTVEYITSVLLEKLFHMKWWDYSSYRFNIGGRVCLLGAIVFGFMSVLLVQYIHPFIDVTISNFPDWASISIASVVFVLLIADLYVTVRHLLLLDKRLSEIQAAINRFKSEYLERAENLKERLQAAGIGIALVMVKQKPKENLIKFYNAGSRMRVSAVVYKVLLRRYPDGLRIV